MIRTRFLGIRAEPDKLAKALNFVFDVLFREDHRFPKVELFLSRCSRLINDFTFGFTYFAVFLRDRSSLLRPSQECRHRRV